ncbi:alpha/beta hydrolase, partial [Acinetobacter baumannii]
DAHIFSQCGHWSQVEKAQEFNQIIKQYLAVHDVK